MIGKYFIPIQHTKCKEMLKRHLRNNNNNKVNRDLVARK